MRDFLEFVSRGSAGVLEEVGDYYWVRVLNRFEMYVHKDDQSVTPCLVRDGFWESWITDYIINNIGPETNFVDVGANTGYYSFLAVDCGARVKAYEPNPVYYAMMVETMVRNKNEEPLVYNSAVSDRWGTATLHVPKSLHGSASFSELDAKWETTPIEVETEPLLMAEDGAYFIKIDAEGAEEKVWDGMVDNLPYRTDPTEVLLEYTPGAYSSEFIDKLEEFAPIHRITEDSQREPVDRAWLESQTDWVMLSLKRG